MAALLNISDLTISFPAGDGRARLPVVDGVSLALAAAARHRAVGMGCRQRHRYVSARRNSRASSGRQPTTTRSPGLTGRPSPRAANSRAVTVVSASRRIT